jgi:acetyltransferase-like isoleucine patch superfamily enzyme
MCVEGPPIPGWARRTDRRTNTMSEVAVNKSDERGDLSIVDRMALRIRRRGTPFDDWLYRTGKAVKGFQMPFFKPLWRVLYYERLARLNTWRNVIRIAYQEPIFKARCDRVGKKFMLRDDQVPLVLGSLRLVVGDNCVISGVTTFAGSKVADDPVLELGDYTHIGYQTVILVGERVTVGKHCMIANRCFIAGADNHATDPIKRRTEAEPKSSLRPLVIEDDVFVATGSTVCKGVTIGRGSIVSAGSVVTRNVPPYTVVAGNPARVVWRMARPAQDA